MKVKVKQIEFHIIETEKEVEVEFDFLDDMSKLGDFSEYADELYQKLIDKKEKFVAYTGPIDESADETKFELLEFEHLPEYMTFLGQIILLDDKYILHYSDHIPDSLHKKEPLKDLYWDYREMPEVDLKSFLRERKIGKILNKDE